MKKSLDEKKIEIEEKCWKRYFEILGYSDCLRVHIYIYIYICVCVLSNFEIYDYT